jgi:putative ABC transport system ATP-binding protein
MMKEQSMSLLEGTNLRKTYRMSRRTSVNALRGVDVRIAAGEMVAIMGPSGSGKSTLMHLLGLLHAPDRNDGPAPGLWFDGTDAGSLSDRDRTRLRARSMGFVFQSFNLVPTLTAEENVALAAEYAGISRNSSRTRAREALGSVGLADRASHRPMELSGGEQQRVAIARAIVNNPRVLLGDEPTGNLDSARAGEVLGLLREFNRERGQTVVLVTHDPEVGATCDRIIRMRDGRIVRAERHLAPLRPNQATFEPFAARQRKGSPSTGNAGPTH